MLNSPTSPPVAFDTHDATSVVPIDDALIRATVAALAAGAVPDPLAEAHALVRAAAQDPGRALALAERRAAGEPLELLLGRGLFMGLSLHVVPGVLVPRAETELLARTALAFLRGIPTTAPRVIDMCTGSGNLAVALAHHAPSARLFAADLTDPCVATARRNAQALGLSERLTVHQGDLFAALEGLGLEGASDMVVCNPPYISTKRLTEGDRAELLKHEPREAFDAGPYGLSIHQRVIVEAADYLRPGAPLLCEFGAGQARQIKILFDRTRKYDRVEFVRDDSGTERVAIGWRTANAQKA